MSSNPSPDQWSLLFRIQSDQLQQQQLQLKHEAALRKLYYKKQLDDHIARTEGRQKRQKLLDVELLKQKQRQDEIYSQGIQRREQEKKRLRKEALEQNLKAVRDKEEELRTAKKKESDVVSQLLKFESESLMKERRSESEKRSRQKTDLINAYNEKMSQDRFRKEMMKTEESVYLQEFRRVEELKEKQREDYINKIRYGFRQNPEAFNNFAELEDKKEEERKSAISTYISPLQLEQFTLGQNHCQKPNSKHQQRSTQIKNLTDQHSKLTCTPEQKQRIKQIEGQLQLGDILDRQIEQKQMQKVKEKHMNGREIRYNKDSFQGGMAMPGLSMNDYHRVRQREILNNSIGLEYRPSLGGGYGQRLERM